MSLNFSLIDNLYPHLKYSRTTAIYIYPYNSIITKYRLSCTTMISNSHYWAPKPTNRSPRTSSARRHTSSINPNPDHHRNHQPIHSTTRTRSATYSQPHSRPPLNSINLNCNNYPIAHNDHSSSPHRHPSSIIDPPRNCSSHHSSLRICLIIKSLFTRKRIMAHQAHAYHMVDPSPWPLTGAVAALLITSGLAI